MHIVCTCQTPKAAAHKKTQTIKTVTFPDIVLEFQNNVYDKMKSVVIGVNSIKSKKIALPVFTTVGWANIVLRALNMKNIIFLHYYLLYFIHIGWFSFNKMHNINMNFNTIQNSLI